MPDGIELDYKNDKIMMVVDDDSDDFEYYIFDLKSKIAYESNKDELCSNGYESGIIGCD